MFSITRDAASALNGLLEQLDASHAECLRLEIRGKQVMLWKDHPRDGDRRFEFEGRNVLVANEATCRACDGMRLDHDDEHSFAIVQTRTNAELN